MCRLHYLYRLHCLYRHHLVLFERINLFRWPRHLLLRASHLLNQRVSCTLARYGVTGALFTTTNITYAAHPVLPALFSHIIYVKTHTHTHITFCVVCAHPFQPGCFCHCSSARSANATTCQESRCADTPAAVCACACMYTCCAHSLKLCST